MGFHILIEAGAFAARFANTFRVAYPVWEKERQQ
jgi:hypothetical protein